ncbi:hypothetical protein PSTT_17024 [Puccinia striiformis]|uniref:Uncharacterized protein n=1 Tax=Puccinia striiformis TaxID=27350 RepID=A0A2S4U9W6_9BASI|nr:hypothetical protein PSTT_17024 [Puccinia striiformis]
MSQQPMRSVYRLEIGIALSIPYSMILKTAYLSTFVPPFPSATPSQSTYLLLIPPRSTKMPMLMVRRKSRSSSSSQTQSQRVDQVVVEAKPRVKYAPLVSSPLVTSRSQLTPCPKSVAFNARIELRHTLQYPHLTASSSHSFRLDVRGLKFLPRLTLFLISMPLILLSGRQSTFGTKLKLLARCSDHGRMMTRTGPLSA